MSSIAAIVTHYQGTQTDEQVQTCVADFSSQMSDGDEIHVFHDGPLHRPWPNLSPAYLHSTQERRNAWGHDLRRLGLLCCNAEYVWFTNADNRLYPGALTCIRGKLVGNGVIFTVKDFFIKDDPGRFRILRAHADGDGRDCMQAVIRRDLWLQHDAWTSLEKEIDGYLIREINACHALDLIDEILGEHR